MNRQCSQLCGRDATCYGLDAGAGGWGGHVCDEHAAIYDWTEDAGAYPVAVESWSEAEAKAALKLAGVTAEQAELVTGLGARRHAGCAADDKLWRKVAVGALSIEGALASAKADRAESRHRCPARQADSVLIVFSAAEAVLVATATGLSIDVLEADRGKTVRLRSTFKPGDAAAAALAQLIVETFFHHLPVECSICGGTAPGDHDYTPGPSEQLVNVDVEAGQLDSTLSGVDSTFAAEVNVALEGLVVE